MSGGRRPRAFSLIRKKIYNWKEKEEWILILKKIIGQHQQDS